MIFRKGLAVTVIDDYNITIQKGSKNKLLFSRDKDDIFTDLDDFIECSVNDYINLYK